MLNHLFVQYSYLQVLDFLTTVAFLLQGVREGNPVVRWAIDLAPSPLSGLLAVKLVAIAMGVACWRLGRGRLLLRMNLLFALVVTWNLVALILRSAL
ncbi:MAG: hypothetical protein HY822_00665 [Acidobacteria bacterium]|nr:hypothetical protein [Acidobacteriota bacterium]